MPRPRVHAPDTTLDVSRELVLTEGPRGASIRRISERSGSPSGSLYHEFGSRDSLIARTWMRALSRFQEGFLAQMQADDPIVAAGLAARAPVDFALSNTQDTELLMSYDLAGLLDAEVDSETAQALADVNLQVAEQVRRLTSRLFRRATPARVERVSLAVIDLPHGALRRHLASGTLTCAVGDRVAAAARDLVRTGP